MKDKDKHSLPFADAKGKHSLPTDSTKDKHSLLSNTAKGQHNLLSDTVKGIQNLPSSQSSIGSLIEKELGGVRIKFDESLKYHCVNGSTTVAEYFYIATTIKELTKALDLALELKIKFFVFGAGSKVLISGSLNGLTIKNRTSGVRISSVKGKVSAKGIGVEEAMVEVESGVSLAKTSEFLKEQNLQQFNFSYIPNSTIGGSLFITPALQDLTEKIKVWSDGEISDIESYELKRDDIILSAVFKVKSITPPQHSQER